MGKQYIQSFIQCYWTHLTSLRDAHWSFRDDLVEMWNGLDSKHRKELRTTFWRFMQEIDRSFNIHRDEMSQLRDQVFLSEDELLDFKEMKSSRGLAAKNLRMLSRSGHKEPECTLQRDTQAEYRLASHPLIHRHGR